MEHKTAETQLFKKRFDNPEHDGTYETSNRKLQYKNHEWFDTGSQVSKPEYWLEPIDMEAYRSQPSQEEKSNLERFAHTKGLDPDCSQASQAEIKQGTIGNDAGFWGRACARQVSKIKDLESSITTLKAEKEELKVEIEEFKKALKSSDKVIGNGFNEITKLREENRQLESTIESLRKENEQLKQK